MILAFDTSGPFVSAILAVGPKRHIRHIDMAKGQAESLMRILTDMVAEARGSWRDLVALGVCVGPGNFTGIRIAMGGANGLGQALSIPVVSISSLEITVWGHDRPCLGLVPGPRTRVYSQVFDPGPKAPVFGEVTDVPSDLTVCHWSAKTPEQRLQALIALTQERYRTTPLGPAKPLYVKPPDAAPSRDHAVRVLS